MATETGRRRKAAQAGAASTENGVAPDVELAKLDALLKQFGTSGYQARMERENPKVARGWEYVGSVPFTHDLFEDVAQKYGGGTFRGRVVDGANDYRGSISPFAIGGEPVQPRVALVHEAAAAPAPIAPPVHDPVETVTKVVAVATPLLAALTGLVKLFARGDRQDSGGDVTATLALVQQAEERGERRGREMGELLADRQPHGESMAEVAREGVSLIGQLINRRGGEPAPRVLNAPAPTAPAAAPASPPAPAPLLVPAGYEWLNELRPYFAQIGAQAKAGRDPHTLAAFVCDSYLPDALIAQMEAVAPDAEFPAVVVAAMADVEPADWRAEFVLAVREWLLTEEAA